MHGAQLDGCGLRDGKADCLRPCKARKVKCGEEHPDCLKYAYITLSLTVLGRIACCTKSCATLFAVAE